MTMQGFKDGMTAIMWVREHSYTWSVSVLVNGRPCTTDGYSLWWAESTCPEY